MSYNGSLEAKKYPGHYAQSWREDETKNGKQVLRVVFELNGEQVEWTCWLDDMTKEDGTPSSNARGLAALGVTREDLQNWARGNELVGLDRAAVDLVLAFNDSGYPFVKWVNDPREMRAAKPLDKGQRANFARKAAAALAALGPVGGGAPPAQQRQQDQGYQGGESYQGGQRRPAGPPPGSDDDIPF